MIPVLIIQTSFPVDSMLHFKLARFSGATAHEHLLMSKGRKNERV